MTNKESNSLATTRTVDLFAAADLLQSMISDLDDLRAGITSPRLAMEIDTHEVREQLRELFETVGLLTNAAEPARAQYLNDKTRDLVKRLARELEYLAREAEAERGNALSRLNSSETAR
jgi:hypothetical protein